MLLNRHPIAYRYK